ncbi:hypothetical protein CPC08DRAFT_226209 [Agrocybe pediades]|nr:hypothetical protein CPC08DRAFT_226209 [Agrocybe pediades]
MKRALGCLRLSGQSFFLFNPCATTGVPGDRPCFDTKMLQRRQNYLIWPNICAYIGLQSTYRSFWHAPITAKSMRSRISSSSLERDCSRTENLGSFAVER